MAIYNPQSIMRTPGAAANDPYAGYAMTNPGLYNNLLANKAKTQSATQSDQSALWNSPGFQDYLKKQHLQNPFDLNSSNPKEQQLATDWLKKTQASFIDNAGQPQRPEFQSQIDPATGLLKGNLALKPGQIDFGGNIMPDLQGRLDNVKLDKTALNQLQNEGMRTGPSAWAGLMKKNLDTRQLSELDAIGAQANGANAGATSSLAMRGGLNSGARTSLAKDMQRSINANAQSSRRGVGSDALNVDLQDETNRLGILSQLPSMQLQAMQPELAKANSLNDAQLTEQARNLDTQKYNADANTAAGKFNIGTAVGEKLQERGYDVNNFNELMKAWAANKTADATASSGKK